MSDSANSEKWIENVGDIMMSEDGEFFWILPQVFVFTYEDCVTSPYFSFDQESWRLVVMPSDGSKSVFSGNNWSGLFLWMKPCNVLSHNYNVQLSVKAPDGEEMCSHSGTLNSFCGFGKWDFLNIFAVEPKHICLSGRIKIRCVIHREGDPSDFLLCSASEEIETKNDTDNSSEIKQKNESESKGVNRLTQNLQKLLNDDENSDVILKTNDHEFRAHRIILGARSPVFSSMFQHDMEEKKNGEVDISDCSTVGFKVFLVYLYTGNADNIGPANVLDLYYIADKYQVADLKSDCVDCLKSSLAIYNICDIIALSLKHNESNLLTFAIRFFCRNFKKIIKTIQWQNFITENPIQANELIIKAVNA